MKEKKMAVILAIIIGIVFAGCLVAYVVIQQQKDKQEDCYARIYQDGELIEEIDLSKVDKTYQKKIKNPDGGYNIIEVRHNSIGIIDADCPDKLCQKQGFSNESLTPIVCLPNRLVIELENKEDTKEELDAITS